MLNAVGTAISTVASAAEETYNTITNTVAPAVSRYVSAKAKAVETKLEQYVSDPQSILEDGLRACISAKNTVAEVAQGLGQWWQETDLNKFLTEKAESISAAWKDSFIGKTIAAIDSSVDKAREKISTMWKESSVGKFVQETSNNIGNFYEKHKTVINFAVGAAVLLLCVAATIVTAGAAAGPSYCLLASMASGALSGAIGGAVMGAAGGTFSGAMSYMEEHDTLDGSAGAIVEAASTGFAAGAISGAVTGAIGGALKPTKCFAAGTLVATAIGLLVIENIQPGMMVYAKDTESQSVELKEVKEIYVHETSEIFKITIGEETYTTTAEHPFYVDGEGFVEAKNLERGDEVVRLEDEKTDLDQESQGSNEVSCLIDNQEQASQKTDQITDQTSNQTSTPTAGYEKGNSTSKEEKNSNSETSGTYVESIQQIYLEDPIKVYNFEVEDSHTYFIGEQEVLVHNRCGAPKSEEPNSSGLPGSTSGNKPSNLTQEGAGRNGAFREAKRNSGIPVSEQPKSVMQAVDKRGNRIPGKDYDFGNGKVIREHSGGHEFPDDPTQNRGPHFNDSKGNHYDYD